ncbi:hypothetical protein M2347_002705 [Chryseobacterium sp. H1D6B]|uniref:hypothetical protein n=1 Tax=Chryseobacterium sp. H1D6B TaxID=2940588 RepID=UPI0015C69AAB|nr:hypothetical protein [Chryseobacterium sp. H1D6B]MDH6252978.1 hypothetical protein [Chryseobacterium sp. H1D6B]
MKIIYFFTALFCSVIIQAQDSLVTKIASEHYQIINFENKKFSGNAIVDLTKTIAQHKYVLIGEDHLNNEVLDFATYLTSNISFDNYITEDDQLSIDILRKGYKKNKEYQFIVSHSNDKFSLFSFNRDREFLYHFFENNKTVIGLDNVYFNADIPVFQELINKTTNKEAKTKYETMMKESNARWDKFKIDTDQKPLPDASNQPYLFSGEFGKKLAEIQKLKLSEYEYYVLNQLAESNTIYSMGYDGKGLESHFLRISTMKEKLLNNLDKMKGKRNLIKFGANHAGKDKSLFQNSFDIGNLVYNLADAEKEKSLHIAVIQKSGRAGSFSSESVDAGDVAFLKPFYQLTGKENEWLLFDLTKINEDIKKQKAMIKSPGLKNLLNGYDYLIIIPKVTAQKLVS